MVWGNVDNKLFLFLLFLLGYVPAKKKFPSISARGGGGKLILFLFGKRERKVTHAKIRHLKKGNTGSEKMASDEKKYCVHVSVWVIEDPRLIVAKAVWRVLFARAFVKRGMGSNNREGTLLWL